MTINDRMRIQKGKAPIFGRLSLTRVLLLGVLVSIISLIIYQSQKTMVISHNRLYEFYQVDGQSQFRTPDIITALQENRKLQYYGSYMKDVDDLNITMWSTDFHISPIADIKAVAAKISNNVKIIDQSLSGHCHLTGTCATHHLHILNKDNGINLGDCPNRLRAQFYDYYSKNSEFMDKVDVVVCTHAASLCELYMPFAKPLIVIASTRYEIGRHNELRWRLWNDNLRRIAAKRGNFVAANNLYDKLYIEHFTGIKNILLLPSLATFVHAKAYTSAVMNGKGEV